MNGNLIINNIVIEGSNYKRILPFSNGLNIINGDKTSGKSLVLAIIDYCLGKSTRIDLKVQKELGEYIEYVFTQFEINNEVITVRRNLKKNYSKFFVYYTAYKKLHEFTPKVMDRLEFLDFMLVQLDIPKFKIPKHKAHSSEKTLEAISFRDIFRYSYINQHDFGTNKFLGYDNYNIRYKIGLAFEVMMSMIEPDQNDLQNEKVNIENQIRNRRAEIRGLTTYLNDKELSDLLQVEIRLTKFKTEIDSYQSAKKKVLDQIVSEKSEAKHIYTSLKKEILRTENQVSDLSKKLQSIEISLLSKRSLLEAYQKDKSELEAAIEAMYKLENNLQSVVCPICSSILSSDHSEHTNVHVVEIAIKQINKRLDLLYEVMEDEERYRSKSLKEMEEHNEYKKILEESITEYQKNIEAPYVSEIESLNKLIGELTQKYNDILEAKRIHNKIDEAETAISRLEKRVEKIDAKLERLEKSLAYKERLIDDINTYYREYMDRFKFNSYNHEVYISEEDYFPYYNDAVVFKHTSGGLLECMQIAYLVSIMRKGSENQKIYHPGLLMLDTIGKYLGTNKTGDEDIKDPEIYAEIYDVLIEASKYSQIIVVDNTPPENALPYIRYTFYDDGRGLVDLSINHLHEDEIIESLLC